MYVCVCNAVTDKQIRKAVRNGASSMADLQQELKVSTCCGKCRNCAKQVLNQALEDEWQTLQPAAAIA